MDDTDNDAIGYSTPISVGASVAIITYYFFYMLGFIAIVFWPGAQGFAFRTINWLDNQKNPVAKVFVFLGFINSIDHLLNAGGAILVLFLISVYFPLFAYTKGLLGHIEEEDIFESRYALWYERFIGFRYDFSEWWSSFKYEILEFLGKTRVFQILTFRKSIFRKSSRLLLRLACFRLLFSLPE